MKCTCELAAREARKAALEEAALIAETTDEMAGNPGFRWYRRPEQIAAMIRALASKGSPA
jgi:quinol monooxygenase YgiN